VLFWSSAGRVQGCSSPGVFFVKHHPYDAPDKTMNEHPILIISGTNRPGSHSLKVAHVLRQHYEKLHADVDLLSMADLPRDVFEPASYAHKPPAMVEIQNRVLRSQGLHVIVPEYNGSFPGVLKYFIDMLKFPESFERKPVAFIGESAGAWGAIRAVEQLQLIFGYRNAYIFPERVFISGVHNRFDVGGNLTDAAIDERLAKQATEFVMFASTLCIPPK
jgi:chromate reductase